MYICPQQNVSVKGVAYIPPSLSASVGFTPSLINKALYEYKMLPQTHLEGEELEEYLRELW